MTDKKQHGGIRTGSGRKKMYSNSKTISFRVPEEIVINLDLLKSYYKEKETTLNQEIVKFLKKEIKTNL